MLKMLKIELVIKEMNFGLTHGEMIVQVHKSKILVHSPISVELWINPL